MVTLTWHACKYMVHKPPEVHPQNDVPLIEDVPLVEFTYLVFTRVPGESYHRRLGLCCCTCVFRALINSIVCWVCTSAQGLILFQISDDSSIFTRELWAILLAFRHVYHSKKKYFLMLLIVSKYLYLQTFLLLLTGWKVLPLCTSNWWLDCVHISTCVATSSLYCFVARELEDTLNSLPASLQALVASEKHSTMQVGWS